MRKEDGSSFGSSRCLLPLLGRQRRKRRRISFRLELNIKLDLNHKVVCELRIKTRHNVLRMLMRFAVSP